MTADEKNEAIEAISDEGASSYWTNYDEHTKEVCLDGFYTADQLRRIADVMDK